MRFIFLLLFVVITAVLTAQQPVTAETKNSAAEPDQVLIKAGTFTMGSNKTDTNSKASEYGLNKPWYLDEHPEHEVALPAFYMDRYEVTSAQYLEYAKATNAYIPSTWMKNGYFVAVARQQITKDPVERLRSLATEIFHFDVDTTAMNKSELEALINLRLRYLDSVPVVSVTWDEANAYCKWRNARLPTEEEWERVARGTDGREFPWGNDWKAGISHTGADPQYEGAAPVDAFVTDVTVDGVRDIAGNVSEWVADWYQPYSGSDYESADFGKNNKVVRGASWSDGSVHYNLRLFQRGAYRFYLPPDGRYEDVGFRCVTEIKSTDASS